MAYIDMVFIGYKRLNTDNRGATWRYAKLGFLRVKSGDVLLQEAAKGANNSRTIVLVDFIFSLSKRFITGRL